MASMAEASPLKAAADLIQTLDTAYAEMTNNAADAAKDAETARKNARVASEIARRYMHRSYPKAQSPFGSSPTKSSPPKGSSSHPSTTILDLQTDLQTGESKIDLNGIAAGLHSPREESKYNGTSNTPLSPSRRKRRPFQTATSTERIAQSHAEDVLALTMELERTKQALKSELRMHEDTKASLASYKAKHKVSEEQNQSLLEELEALRQTSSQTNGELEQELANSKLRLQAAEEDAQLALDLAKDSAEKRDEMEAYLQQALVELQTLKQQQAAPETPKRTVRFADSTPPPPPPPPAQTMTPSSLMTPRSASSSTPRAMVAAGRQLLRRSLASPSDEVVTLELTPAKSAERRRRLKERLTKLDHHDDDDPVIHSPPRSPVSPRVDRSSPVHKKLVEECQNATKLLQESGHRLDLGGHWWRDDPAHPIKKQHQDIHLEAMTRQYSQSVEVSKQGNPLLPDSSRMSLSHRVLVLQFKIERQQKEINELESLCGFLEKKLVADSDSN